MLKLQAYQISDLQKFVNLLNQAEGQSLTVPEIRAQVEAALHTDRLHVAKAVRSGRDRKSAVLPSKKCPECNSLMQIVPADEGTNKAVWECKQCLLSIYKGKTFEQLINEVKHGS